MTIPGVLMGKRTHLVCVVFSPLDWIEDKLTGGTSTEKDERIGIPSEPFKAEKSE